MGQICCCKNDPHHLSLVFSAPTKAVFGLLILQFVAIKDAQSIKNMASPDKFQAFSEAHPTQEYETMTLSNRLTVLKTHRTNAPVQQDHFTLAMHQEAENALSMALHCLRSSNINVPGATRKAAQALGALNRLEMLSLGANAHPTGRA